MHLNLPPSYPGPATQKPTIYTGPPVPTEYGAVNSDGPDDWQYFTNLTPEQIAWYQSQPEWHRKSSQ
jgi:hypothetical protein